MDALLQQLEKICHIENTQQALEAYQQLERVLVQASNDQKAEFYLHYAFFMFRLENYDQCMNFFAQAQEYGFPKEEIRQIVYEAFIEPNLEECKENYETTIEQLKDNIYIDEDVSFEDLDLWFIPTLTTKKYFYNRLEEKIISIDVDDKRAVELPRKTNPFGDYLFANDGNIYEIISYIRRIPNEKKLYVYTEKIKYLFSFFQLPDMSRFLFFMQQTKIFGNQQDVVSYFIGCNAYLPRNFISTSQSFTKKDIEDLIHEIHNQRIHDLTRKRDNILLTIGIPSYNRGHRAYESVIHHLQSEYDDEIEIVVSNNGTDNYTAKFYEKISNIEDARITYFSFESNQFSTLNFAQVINLAKGKFVFMLSDEDTIFIKKLDILLQVIVSNRNLSMIKAYGDGQQRIQSTGLASQGEDAIRQYGFTANYLSGNVFRRDLLLKVEAISYVKENYTKKLCINFYSHIFYELLLCMLGDVYGINAIVIHEGASEQEEDFKSLSKEVIEEYYINDFPKFALYKERLKQHFCFLSVFQQFQIFYKNKRILRLLYLLLCGKTFHLVKISIAYYHKKNNDDIQMILKDTYETCIIGLKEIYEVEDENYHREYKEITNLYYNTLKEYGYGRLEEQI